MKNTFLAVLSLVTLVSVNACTEPTTQLPANAPKYSQGPTDTRDLGARNAPSDRSMMRDHTMPATAM